MKVFWHICLINHWAEITLEQLRLIVESGLYDEAEGIFIGCLGDKKSKVDLDGIISGFPKIEISYYSEDIVEYEFATLKILQQFSLLQVPFYGLYLHSKGSSYPYGKNPQGYIGGTKWRNYLNYYLIERWRDCVKQLDLGYELCGVKLLSPRHSPSKRLHYSGNYFMFNSEYIRTLPKIETLNHADRYEAEMWVCSNSPIAATLCQDFIDYNSKGVFVPSKHG